MDLSFLLHFQKGQSQEAVTLLCPVCEPLFAILSTWLPCSPGVGWRGRDKEREELEGGAAQPEHLRAFGPREVESGT